MATRPDRKLTYEDYLGFPEGERFELIDGEAYVIASPNTRHQRVILRLLIEIEQFLRAHGGGEVFVAPFDVVLSEFDVLQPDIVFLADADRQVLTEANIWGAPTWAIEVLSPHSHDRDRRMKLQRYERFGVQEYWIVDPEADAVDVHRLQGAAYGPATTVRPPAQAAPLRPAALSIDLSAVFAR